MGLNDVKVLYPIHQKVFIVEENLRKDRLCPRSWEVKDIRAVEVIGWDSSVGVAFRSITRNFRRSIDEGFLDG